MRSLPRCVAFNFDALYFVKYLQDGFTKTHAWGHYHDALRSSLMLCILGVSSDTKMRCFFFSDWRVCIFVNDLQRLANKIQTHAMTRRCVCIFVNSCKQSTESPILFRSCEHETTFSGQNEASKIGDSVLWLQRWVYEIQTHAMTRRCVAFFVGLRRLYLCKLFAKMVYKIQTHAMTRRCVAFLSDWCVCIFVNYLQRWVYKYKRRRWHDDAFV